MLQGALYLVLSIWALLAIECQFDMTSTNLGTIMYFIYFRNSACTEVIWSRSSYQDVANLPKVTFVAERTEGLVIFYIAISFLWVLTSLLVIVGATRRKLSKTAFHCYFTPWAIVIIAGCLLDVIATVFHIIDICHTTTAESTFEYLNVQNIWEILPAAERNYSHFSFPSIIFTCVSCRLLVLFLFNFFGMIWAVRQATQLIFKPEGELEQNERSTSESIENPVIHQPLPSQYYYVPARLPLEPAGKALDPYRRTFEPLKSDDNPVNIVPQDLYAIPGEKKHKRINVPSHVPQIVSANQADMVVQRRRDSGSQYPEKRHSGNSQNGHRIQIDVGRSQSDRYAEYERNTEQHRISAPVERPTSYVTGELRGQLPWSYFNAREDIVAPRKTLAHVEDHEVLPPVPVPDYTLHFPRKDRYTIQDRAAQLQAATSPPTSQTGGTRW